MATKSPGVDVMTEPCESCDRETAHSVHVELKTESPDTSSATAAFSREPYRVAECQACGTTHSQRMNNA